MSESEDKQHLAPLPDSLREQLESFKKHLWRIKITEAVLAGLIGLLFSFALIFALDRFWEIPPLVRLIVLIAGVSLFAVFAPFWINRWVFKHRKENQLARHISKHYPNLGDRLLGVVELQNQDESQKALSPELREAAMVAVANETKDRNLSLAISSSWTRKLALGFTALALVAGGAFIAYPKAGKNALARWFMPLSKTERFTFTQVDMSKIPQPLYTPIGEKFTIPIHLKKETEDTPSFAKAKYTNAKWQNYPYSNDKYTLEFPGKREKGTVSLLLGDAKHKITVQPIHRPKISGYQQEIIYPEYLQREPIRASLATTQTEVLTGSKVTITASADRKLSSAKFHSPTFEPHAPEIDEEEAEIQGIDINAKPEPVALSLNHTISGNSVITDPIKIKDGTITLPLSWVDEYGIAGIKSSEFTINSVPDLPPVTYTERDSKSTVMLYNQVLKFKLAAEDNYGIKKAGIVWKGEFTTPSPDTPASAEKTLLTGDPYMTSSNKEVLINFVEEGITPQKLEVRTWVEDYNPDTPRIFSEPITIFILSKEEHADHLRDKVDSIQTKMQDVTRTEQENLEKNKQLLKDLKNPKKAAEAKAKLAEQKRAELENKDEVKKLAQEMTEAFKEAIKNDSIKSKALKDMKDVLKDLKDMAKKDMPEVADDLDKAQNKKNSEEKTKKDLDSAIKKQKKLIEKMKKTSKKADRAKLKLEAGTFVNRLRKAAAQEEAIAGTIIQEANNIFGLHYNELDPELKKVIQRIFLSQEKTTSDIRWILEDLTFFHQRTETPIHKEIVEKMNDEKIKDDKTITEFVASIERQIEEQHTAMTIDNVILTAKKLREWAKLLEQAKDEDSSQGESDGGSPPPNNEDKDFEFMLKVMKMIQAEQLLRDKTRALEESKRNALKSSPAPLP